MINDLRQKEPPSYFSKELTAIFGRTQDGRSNLRVIWGDDPKFFVLRMDGEKVPRYPTYRRQRLKGFFVFEDGRQLPGLFTPREAADYAITHPVYEVTYKGIQKWVLEGWNPAERLVPGWEDRRWDKDYNPPIDVLGPPPRDGDYDFIKFLEYLNEKTLDDIRRLAKIAEADHLSDSYFERRLATKEEIRAAIMRDDLLEAEYEAKKAAEMRERIVSNLMPLQKFMFHNLPNEGGGRLLYRTVKK